MAVAALLLGACSQTGAERGQELFEDPEGLSASSFNRQSCATCHGTEAEPDPARRYAGYSLHGVVARPSYWGGQTLRLLDAVNVCVEFFMRGQPLAEDDPDAHALYDFLVSITPDGSPSAPLPMTVVEEIAPLPLGDAGRGEALYAAACEVCHGDAGTGAGGNIEPPRVLPDYALAEYPDDFPGVAPGLVVIEKVRHGRFFHITGVMPPYTLEALTDAELGDLLAFLGLPSE